MHTHPIHTLLKPPATLLLALALLPCALQAQDAPSATANSASSNGEVYRTLYLTNLTASSDAGDLVVAMRNMLPQAHICYVPAQAAIAFRGTPRDATLAQTMLTDLDRTRKTYRLTYTVTEIDGGKPASAPRTFSLVAASGNKVDIKKGTKVPIVSGDPGNAGKSAEVQYQDIGLEAEAIVDSYHDGLRLHSRIAESSVADEKSSIGVADPIFHQATLDSVATLTPGKPVILGSLDVPGTTRHQQFEVVAEPLP